MIVSLPSFSPESALSLRRPTQGEWWDARRNSGVAFKPGDALLELRSLSEPITLLDAEAVCEGAPEVTAGIEVIVHQQKLDSALFERTLAALAAGARVGLQQWPEALERALEKDRIPVTADGTTLIVGVDSTFGREGVCAEVVEERPADRPATVGVVPYLVRVKESLRLLAMSSLEEEDALRIELESALRDLESYVEVEVSSD